MKENNRKAYVCLHVFENTRPVKLVTKDADGWSFLCGELHPNTVDFCRVVGSSHLFERDSTLEEIADLSDGWEAEREYVGGPWIITPSEAN